MFDFKDKRRLCLELPFVTSNLQALHGIKKSEAAKQPVKSPHLTR